MKTSANISEELKAKISKAKDVILKEYYKSNNIVDALEIAVLSNTNLLIYGEPGMGKSTIVTRFFDLVFGENNYYLKTLGPRTQPDHLFGGFSSIDAALQENYNLENSFMAHEYVILEELFDMPVNMLSDLKDPLSRGIFANGKLKYKLKCKCIIGITNHSPEELITNDATKAILDRFTLKVSVKNNYKFKDYKSLIKMIIDNYNASFTDDYADVLSSVSTYFKLSPRHIESFIKISSQINNNDFSLLSMIDNNISESGMDFAQLSKLVDYYCKYKEVNKNLVEALNGSKTNYEKAEQYINANLNKLKENSKSSNELSKRLTEISDNLKKCLDDFDSGLQGLSSFYSDKNLENPKSVLEAIMKILETNTSLYANLNKKLNYYKVEVAKIIDGINVLVTNLSKQ